MPHLGKMADPNDNRVMDIRTDRPRTPNIPYTTLTDTQVSNIKKDASPFFQSMQPEAPALNLPCKPGGRYYVDHYCNVTSENLVRGPSGTQPFGWIDQQKLRDAPEEYNTCRDRASARWGENKAGERTRSHFFGESIDRYTTIDMYRRNPTNTPGPVIMKYGRPAGGYYAQKNPAKTTWCQSSVPLNRPKGLQDIYPKTTAEYANIRQAEQSARFARTEQWPEYTEYTDRYLLATDMLPSEPNSLEDKESFSLKT